MKRLTSTLKMLAGVAVTGVAYSDVVRPWYNRWGATDAEIARPMPLDDEIAHPRLVSTRAITINATPEQIWPWLVQMGEPPRAGYYSYTAIERLAGLQVVNRDVVLPEFQSLQVGDVLDRNGTMTVRGVEPGQYLVLGPPPSFEDVKATWAFALFPIDEHSTRLVTRVRSDWSYRRMLGNVPLATLPVYLLIEPGAFIMERRMLHEIKHLAEQLAARDDFPSVVIRPFTWLERAG